MSINDRIRSLAATAGCDYHDLRETLVTLSDRLKIHLDEAVAHAEDLRGRLAAPSTGTPATASAGWRPSWTGGIDTEPAHWIASGPRPGYRYETVYRDGKAVGGIEISETAIEDCAADLLAMHEADLRSRGLTMIAPSPRFAVMRGAEAVGRLAIGAWTTEGAAQAHASRPTWMDTAPWRVSELGGPVDPDKWFVVDTHAPVAVATVTSGFAGGPRERVYSLGDYAIITGDPIQPDEDIVAVLRCRPEQTYDGGLHDGAMVNGYHMPESICRAAWSRVLAAKVRASDEKRQRDAMVYGPIDDGDEVGAKDA